MAGPGHLDLLNAGAGTRDPEQEEGVPSLCRPPFGVAGAEPVLGSQGILSPLVSSRHRAGDCRHRPHRRGHAVLWDPSEKAVRRRAQVSEARVETEAPARDATREPADQEDSRARPGKDIQADQGKTVNRSAFSMDKEETEEMTDSVPAQAQPVQQPSESKKKVRFFSVSLRNGIVVSTPSYPEKQGFSHHLIRAIETVEPRLRLGPVPLREVELRV